MYLQEQIGVQIFCPNCGHKNAGRILPSGSVSIECDRCCCILVSKKIKGKHGYIIKVNKN